ncbi:hypothetical protein TNIN_224691 [Trichonephila inaurata madagascariensis]|uniref:Uncharacterized protein n=1 Tax=Trichonephila inaurata madagascariensis TaxID=2747483 RepID=A0A8X6YD83_9ARAC|nr:hypothetical protein TNIN_224691 [Trichonephila inaurata madagascariensis]
MPPREAEDSERFIRLEGEPILKGRPFRVQCHIRNHTEKWGRSRRFQKIDPKFPNSKATLFLNNKKGKSLDNVSCLDKTERFCAIKLDVKLFMLSLPLVAPANLHNQQWTIEKEM